MDKQEYKNLNHKISHEGKLLRDKGHNSIKSLKDVMETKLGDISSVLESVSGAIQTQVSSLDSIANINKESLVKQEERDEDKLREDTFKEQSETKDDGVSATDVARGTFMADLATSMREGLVSLVGKFNESMIGTIVKTALVGLGTAFVGAPFLQGFFEQAFGIDLKSEILEIKDNILKFTEGFIEMLPELKSLLGLMATFYAAKWTAKLIKAIGALSLAVGGLMSGGKGLLPDVGVDADGKKNPKKSKWYERLKDMFKRSPKPKGTPGWISRLAGYGIAALASLGVGGSATVAGTVYAGYDAHRTVQHTMENMSTKAVMTPESAKAMAEGSLSPEEEAKYREAIEAMIAENQKRIDNMLSMVGDNYKNTADYKFLSHEVMRGQKLLQGTYIEPLTKEQLHGEAKDVSSYIPKEMPPTLFEPKMDMGGLQEYLANTSPQTEAAPTIINSFNNTNAPTSKTNNVIAGGGSGGSIAPPIIYSFTTNHMIGQGTMN